MIDKKRAQISIFIVLGFVVLIGGIFFFYLTRDETARNEPEIKIVQQNVPFDFQPLKDYVDKCVYSLSLEGLRIIGKHGGYISFSDSALNRQSFAASRNPTETDAVYFDDDADLKTAYWWYLRSPNNCEEDCVFTSKRPDLRSSENSIEKQLERYVNLHFEECLNDFAIFREQNFRVERKANPRSDVTIASSDITVLVDYPLNAKKGELSAEMSQFTTRVPINLDKLYDLATKITNMEIKHNYLEKHVLDLLVAYSGAKHDRLPPMSDVQFGFSPATWQKSEIKSRIISLLQFYIQLLQVDGTNNYQRNLFESELKQRIYDSTIIPVGNSSFRDISADFTYLDLWPPYFDLNCDGERCVPSSANSLIQVFGVELYRFSYDLSFPVMVEVKDPGALDGAGYSFNFFLEGNIRNNKPMAYNSSGLELVPLGISEISDISQMCDVRTSGNITVIVRDAVTKQPVSNAQVLYTVTEESCSIGQTGVDGSLSGQFPVGIGGVVNIVRDGFIGKAVEYDPKVDVKDGISVDLWPIYTKRAVVRKKSIIKTPEGWAFRNTAEDLSRMETASLSLTRLSREGELDFTPAITYSGSDGETPDIEIAPGMYEANGNLILEGRIVIPQKEKCVSKIFGKECFTIPELDFGEGAGKGQERFPEGGLRLNFTIDPANLAEYDTIVFNVLSIGVANIPEQDRVMEDVNEMSKIDDYSRIYQVALQPEFE